MSKNIEDIINSVINTNIIDYVYNLSPMYEEYVNNIKNTYVYKYYTREILVAKMHNWDIDNNEFIPDFNRIKYAAMLEQFIEDDTAEMFAIIFKDYIISIFNSDDRIFRDIRGNTIFHYDAVQGNRLSQYKTIQDTVNHLIRIETGIDDDLFDIDILGIKNLSNISVLNVINSNI